ncbi:MAG: diacylglycerol kinase family lipid kinase [Clostridia bacterium]|nr:diacylglycerol kinase family lipid kinase [Clostridia bacterium]
MITLIVNPDAGNGKSKKVVNTAIKSLKEKNLSFRVWEAEAYGSAKALAEKAAGEYNAAAEEPEFLIAVGGDGTFLEVVRGILGSGMPVATLPAGTGNDFLKSLGVPIEPIAALEHILDAEVRTIDVGKVGDKLFANECGAGFDVTVLDHAFKARRYIKGPLSYLWGVISAIFTHKSRSMAISADGKEVFRGDCLVFSVANGKYIGGGIPIAPEADPTNGKLELTVIADCSRPRMCSYLPGLLAGKILTFKHTVVHCRADTVQVKTLTRNSTLRVNVDGEISDMERCDFAVLPAALPIHM